MNNGSPRRLLWFVLGVATGVGALHLAQSGKAKKVAVAVAAKGIELKNKLSADLERGKESLEDALAEAKFVAEQNKKNG